MQDFSPSPYYFSTGLWQSGDTHSQKGTYNTSFVPAVLASCTFQITEQDPVSYVQSTEWNSTSVSKLYSNVWRKILLNISSQAVERDAKPH